MESIFRIVRKSTPAAKHSKLGEGWDVNREAVTEGVTFYLKYLGSTLLEELPEGESYGEGVSAKAVQRIVDMAKSLVKKLVKVLVNITPNGIKVTNMESNDPILDVTIYRISFCTADKNHEKVFAFIARNTINETMECHAFYCAKQKVAQAVTLSVYQAFTLAKDKWENEKNVKNNQQMQHSVTQHSLTLESANQNQSSESPKPRKILSAPNIDLILDSHSRLPMPEGSKSLHMPARSASPRQGWQTFDDTNVENKVTFNIELSAENKDLDDCFSQLAENRSRKQLFLECSTNLCQEDLDDGVQTYMVGSKSLEAFSLTKSEEDLFNI